jgi:hypothetical protein
MEMGQPGVERGQTSLPAARELGEVCVRDLPMADDAIHWDCLVRKHVGPEFVSFVVR